MSVLLQTVVRMPYASGLPRDVAENTFSFNVDDSTVSTFDNEIRDRLLAYYNANPGGTGAIATFLSPIIQRPQCTLRLYPLDPSTGLQVASTRVLSFALGTTAVANSLPFEVAVCSTVRGGGLVGIVPLARRTGRQYIGPLVATALTTGANPQPAFALTSRIVASSAALAAENDGDAAWCVWSRTSGTLTPIDRGWVDNEWDTQRRRGDAATTRSFWP